MTFYDDQNLPFSDEFYQSIKSINQSNNQSNNQSVLESIDSALEYSLGWNPRFLQAANIILTFLIPIDFIGLFMWHFAYDLKQPKKQATNQSNNQSINQSNDQTINQSSDSLNHQPNDRSISKEQSYGESDDYPIDQSIDLQVNQSSDQSVDQSINQSNNRSNDQSNDPYSRPFFDFSTLSGWAQLMRDIKANMLPSIHLTNNQSNNQICTHSNNQSNNQSIYQSNIETINQSINQTNNQSINQSKNRIFDLQNNESCNFDDIEHQSMNQSNVRSTTLLGDSFVQSDNQSINQTNNQPVNRSIDQSTNRTIKQSIKRAVSQSIKCLFCPLIWFLTPTNIYSLILRNNLIDYILNFICILPYNLIAHNSTSVELQTVQKIFDWLIGRSTDSSMPFVQTMIFINEFIMLPIYYRACYRSNKQTIEQTINQSTSQSNNQSINQFINQKIDESIKQPIKVSIDRSDDQASDLSSTRESRLLTDELIKQSNNQTINGRMLTQNRFFDLPSINQSINQTNRESNFDSESFDSLNQSIDQCYSSHHSINGDRESIDHSIDQSIDHSIDQPVDELNLSTNQSTKLSRGRSGHRSIIPVVIVFVFLIFVMTNLFPLASPEQLRMQILTVVMPIKNSQTINQRFDVVSNNQSVNQDDQTISPTNNQSSVEPVNQIMDNQTSNTFLNDDESFNQILHTSIKETNNQPVNVTSPFQLADKCFFYCDLIPSFANFMQKTYQPMNQAFLDTPFGLPVVFLIVSILIFLDNILHFQIMHRSKPSNNRSNNQSIDQSHNHNEHCNCRVFYVILLTILISQSAGIATVFNAVTDFWRNIYTCSSNQSDDDQSSVCSFDHYRVTAALIQYNLVMLWWQYLVRWTAFRALAKTPVNRCVNQCINDQTMENSLDGLINHTNTPFSDETVDQSVSESGNQSNNSAINESVDDSAPHRESDSDSIRCKCLDRDLVSVSNDQPCNESITSICQTNHESIDVGLSTDQLKFELTKKIDQSTKQTVDQSVSQPHAQAANQTTNQQTNQSFDQTIKQSINQNSSALALIFPVQLIEDLFGELMFASMTSFSLGFFLFIGMQTIKVLIRDLDLITIAVRRARMHLLSVVRKQHPTNQSEDQSIQQEKDDALTQSIQIHIQLFNCRILRHQNFLIEMTVKSIVIASILSDVVPLDSPMWLKIDAELWDRQSNNAPDHDEIEARIWKVGGLLFGVLCECLLHVLILRLIDWFEPKALKQPSEKDCTNELSNNQTDRQTNNQTNNQTCYGSDNQSNNQSDNHTIQQLIIHSNNLSTDLTEDIMPLNNHSDLSQYPQLDDRKSQVQIVDAPIRDLPRSQLPDHGQLCSSVDQQSTKQSINKSIEDHWRRHFLFWMCCLLRLTPLLFLYVVTCLDPLFLETINGTPEIDQPSISFRRAPRKLILSQLGSIQLAVRDQLD